MTVWIAFFLNLLVYFKLRHCIHCLEKEGYSLFFFSVFTVFPMTFSICPWLNPFLIIHCVASEMDSFSKYLLNTHYVLGSMLRLSWNLHANRGETKNKQDKGD